MSSAVGRERRHMEVFFQDTCLPHQAVPWSQAKEARIRKRHGATLMLEHLTRLLV